MSKLDATPWDGLTYNQQLRLFNLNSPRVPSGWLPKREVIRATRSKKDLRPEAVIVTLTPFLLELSEAELWEFLHESWDRNGITPQSVIFRTPAGQNVITLPVTYGDTA